MEPDLLRDLIEQFEKAVQPPPDLELPARERGLRQGMKDHQFDPRDVIAAQVNKTLVLAMQRNFFFREVFDEFCCRFEPIIRSWLIHWGVEYHRAFDLAQTLLLDCFRKRLRTYDLEQGNLEGYLRRATYNLWMAKDVRPAGPKFSSLPEELLQRGPDAEEELAGREMEQRLDVEMARLPQEQRAVLDLHYREHLSHADIAARLGISTKDSQRRLFQARRILEERLGLSLPPTKRGRPRRAPPLASA
jgi:RNA polymerase sigma-70 factor (ECF subfamily)